MKRTKNSRTKEILPKLSSQSSSSSSPTSTTASRGSLSHQYCSEFDEIQKIIKSSIKTKKDSVKDVFGQILTEANKTDLCHDDWEMWAMKHGKKLTLKYTTNEIRQLRKWFLELDKDGSGEVSYHELIDPLLSAGIVKSKDDVKQLIKLVDTDGSGEINFYEFLNALNQDKLCDSSKINILQDITRVSTTGLSTAMKLSEERRKHLLTTVIDDTMKRQHEIDKIYLRHSPYSHPTYHSSQSKKRPMKLNPLPQVVEKIDEEGAAVGEGGGGGGGGDLTVSSLPSQDHHLNNSKFKFKPKLFETKLEKVALLHHKQVMKSTQYITSLEPIVSSHKQTIALDNVVDTTKTRDLYNTSIRTIIEDPNLDIGYKDGLEGRRKSLHRLNFINSTEFGHGTFIQLKQLDQKRGRSLKEEEEEDEEEEEGEQQDEEEEYRKYDSHYSVYSPIEVVDTQQQQQQQHKQKHLTHHHRHQLHRQGSSTHQLMQSHSNLNSKNSSKNLQIPKLAPIVQHSPSFSFPSQRFTKSNLHPEDASCNSGRITLRRQPSSSRLSSDDPTQQPPPPLSHPQLSPTPSGRKYISKSHSKTFLKQSSFQNSSPHSNNNNAPSSDQQPNLAPKRRSSVVKRFYRDTPPTNLEDEE